MAAVDSRGRVADHTILTALGWTPGQPLTIQESGGVLVLRPDPHGGLAVTNQGYLRLPATMRHRCGLVGGDRVLLVAHPGSAILIVHPPASLDTLLAARHTDVLGGDPV